MRNKAKVTEFLDIVSNQLDLIKNGIEGNKYPKDYLLEMLTRAIDILDNSKNLVSLEDEQYKFQA